MLYKDFLTLQEQLKTILVDYSYFLKKGAQLNYKYIHYFKDEVLKDFQIRNENTMLVTAITMLKDKKKLDEVDKYLEDYKLNYQKELSNLNKRILAADKVCNTKINDEAQKELEEHFLDLVRNYYPALRLEENQEYVKSFELLQLLYQQNNYNTYFATYDLFKNLFVEKNYQNVDYDKYANVYLNLMQRVTTDTVQRKQGFPYTKEDAFEDEITIAREKGDFRANLNKLSEANKVIKEDFKEAYGELVELK